MQVLEKHTPSYRHLLCAAPLALLAACAGPGEGAREDALHECPTYPLPANLASMTGRVTDLDGYMVPLTFDDGMERVASFILTSAPTHCCEGEQPEPDEWVHVAMAEGTTAPYFGEEPVTVSGMLLRTLPDEWREAGGIYALEATRVDALTAATR